MAIFRLCPLEEAIQIIESILNKIQDQERPDSDAKQEAADETIEKIIPNLEINEIQDLNKHIHESDAKSSDDKQEVADVTIEKMQEPDQTPNIKKFECSICGK